MAPTHEAIQVFTSQDITKDSRYEGTFTTAYYGNWEKAGISRIAYPGLWKLGCYRTDYDFATQLGSPNAGSTRPYDILKFSDFYLTAAEAAFKLGDNAKARSNLLVLRRRAGVWTWKERAGSYTISGSSWGSHKPETFTRTIEDYMYLRPIPQGQLNGMDMTDAEKAAYQNPGYPVE